MVQSLFHGRKVLIAAALTVLVAAPAARADFQGTPGKIAVVDGGGLAVYDPYAGNFERQPLDTDNVDDYAPSWSPDGTKVAYVKEVDDPGRSGETHSAIFYYDLADGTTHQVSKPPAGFPGNSDPGNGNCGSGWTEQSYATRDKAPTWSPDGKKIAFVRDFSGRMNRIYTCDAVDPCAPPWGDPPEQNIWTADVGGGNEQRLTHGTDPNGSGTKYYAPVWGAGGVLAAQSGTGSGCATDSSFHVTVELDTVTAGGSRSALPVDGGKVLNYDWSPDGKQLAVELAGGSGPDSNFSEVIDDHGGITKVPEISNLYRFSPDGNGLIGDGCVTDKDGNQQCGIVEHRLPDPDGDVRDSDPMDRLISAQVPYNPSGHPGVSGTTTELDVQAQQLPVIFIPGFLGSEIQCNGRTQWLSMSSLPDWAGMRLGDDGLTNAGCAGSAPDGQLVDFAYGSTQTWIQNTFGTRGGVFAWDWRKAPQPTLSKLDGFITQMLNKPLPKAEGATRVTIMAHSYGGLLTRTYISDQARANRVARILTVGTPYWGVSKAIFSLGFGIELPVSPLNVSNRADLKAFSRTMGGLIQLFPSPKLSPWLVVDGKALSGDALKAFLFSLGLNTKLYDAAQANHTGIYDQFDTNGGKIDYRQVVGTGLSSPGTVTIKRGDGQLADASIDWVNGDGTVTGKSQTTGDIGTQPPDPNVHVQDICGVSHLNETGSELVQNPYKDFLDYGRYPRKTGGPCPMSAGWFDFVGASGTLGPDLNPDRRRAAGAPMTLEQAHSAGKIQLYELPASTIAVVDRVNPVTLGGTVASLSFTYTPVTDNGNGATVHYGPLTGRLAIGGGAGAPLGVTVNGKPVKPGQSVGTNVEIRTGRARLSGGRLRIRVACLNRSGTCRGKLKVKAGRRTLGSGRFSVRAKHQKAVKVKLVGSAKGLVKHAKHHRLAAQTSVGTLRRALVISG